MADSTEPKFFKTKDGGLYALRPGLGLFAWQFIVKSWLKIDKPGQRVFRQRYNDGELDRITEKQASVIVKSRTIPGEPR